MYVYMEVGEMSVSIQNSWNKGFFRKTSDGEKVCAKEGEVLRGVSRKVFFVFRKRQFLFFYPTLFHLQKMP